MNTFHQLTRSRRRDYFALGAMVLPWSAVAVHPHSWSVPAPSFNVVTGVMLSLFGLQGLDMGVEQRVKVSQTGRSNGPNRDQVGSIPRVARDAISTLIFRAILAYQTASDRTAVAHCGRMSTNVHHIQYRVVESPHLRDAMHFIPSPAQRVGDRGQVRL